MRFRLETKPYGRDYVPYKKLRTLVGVLGMALPLFCLAGGYAFYGHGPQRSISYYYHTNMRDYLTGLLLCVSAFMWSYDGYDIRDKLAARLACVASLGVALFPCLESEAAKGLPVGVFGLEAYASAVAHTASAVVFFIVLGVNSLCLFTLSDKARIPRGTRKWGRNVVYRVAGWAILGALALAVGLYFAKGKEWMDARPVLLVLEAVMLVAFGVSWLVKGLGSRGREEPAGA